MAGIKSVCKTAVNRDNRVRFMNAAETEIAISKASPSFMCIVLLQTDFFCSIFFLGVLISTNLSEAYLARESTTTCTGIQVIWSNHFASLLN